MILLIIFNNYRSSDHKHSRPNFQVHPAEKKMARGLGLEDEPWRKKGFFEMSRRQQNGQIYDVRRI